MSKKLLPLLIISLCSIGIPRALCVDFVDVTDEAGVPGTGVGNGVAFADYDNDGDLDIYVSADPHDILYRNNGDGTFEDVTAAAGISVRGDGVAVAFGDHDNDGDLDLYVAVNDGWDIFFQNDGDGVFQDITREVKINNPNRARSATFADFDNDGFLDIYVANENAANILYKNRNGETFQNVAQIMNVAHWGPGRCSVWGDYDNDGDLDLYVTNKGAPNILYRNDVIGFKDVTEDAGVGGPGDSTGVSFADYDNDGDLDIYVGSDGQSFLYRNNGDGTFRDVAANAGVAHVGEATPAFADYDNDRDLDLYVAVWKGRAVLYRNNGDGTFEDATQEAGLGALGNGWSAIFGDYDGDGDLDIYASYTTRSNILYQNNGNDNNWLHIKTVAGASSNRNSIGARIELSAGGMSQIREVSGGTGYGSQDSLTVEFGLGENVVADAVEIRWPSSIVTRLTNVQANQLILAEENPWAVETLDRHQESSIKNPASRIQYPASGTSCLLPNYPNPFNPDTWLPYQLAEHADVKIVIYDSSGCLIRTLNLGHRKPGIYVSKSEAAYWDGKGNDGEQVAAGVYFCQLRIGCFLHMRKVVLRK